MPIRLFWACTGRRYSSFSLDFQFHLILRRAGTSTAKAVFEFSASPYGRAMVLCWISWPSLTWVSNTLLWGKGRYKRIASFVASSQSLAHIGWTVCSMRWPSTARQVVQLKMSLQSVVIFRFQMLINKRKAYRDTGTDSNVKVRIASRPNQTHK